MLNNTYLLSSFCIFMLCSVHLGLCDLYLLIYSIDMSLVNCSIQVFFAQEDWSVSGRFCLDCQPFCLKHRDTCETWGLVSLVMQYLCIQNTKFSSLSCTPVLRTLQLRSYPRHRVCLVVHRVQTVLTKHRFLSPCRWECAYLQSLLDLLCIWHEPEAEAVSPGFCRTIAEVIHLI